MVGAPRGPSSWASRGAHRPPLAETEDRLQDQDRAMVQNVILVFFRRRLSQRPGVEELESRNILKRE